MPAARAVNKRSIGQRPIGGARVELVAGLVEERIIAASLLAHELERFIRQRRVNIVRDREAG